MTMATETVGRRPGKTPLIKQPEIEEVEEEKGEEQTGSPNSDKSDTTITAGIDTPCANSASSGSPDTGSPNEQSQDSSEKQEPAAKVNHMQSKPKTLQRAEAFRDDSSPPPAIVAGVYPAEEQIEYGEIVELATIPGSRSLEKDGSQSSEAGTSSTLSRESSLDTQYKDSTGIDLEEFIKKTLNKSVKDRKMMLQLAKDLKKFIKEPKHQFLQFAEMSSYDRMLIHRVAAFFGLDHNVDQSGKAVIVSKTKITRIPDFNFEDHIQRTGDSQLKNSQRKIVLVRKAPSLEEKESKGLEKHQFGNNRAKSLEERQKSYEEAKARIFKNGEGQDVLAYPLLRSGKSSLVSSKEDLGSRQHSTDSSGYGSSENSNKSRICMHKSNSYGGMTSHAPLKFQSGSLSKADSVSSGASGSFESPPMRPYPVPLSPPGSHSDQSQLSRSSSTGPIQSPHTSCSNITSQGSPYAFLVAMDTNTIPPGSMIVNPQTLQPHHNPDGSVYRYDPAQPPPWLMGGGSVPQSVSTQSFPSNMPSPYSSEQEVCQRFPSMTISHQSQDIMQDSQGGSAPQPPQGSQVLMSSQAPFPAQQPGTYIQTTCG